MIDAAEEAIRQAERARALLDNPLLAGAFAELEADFLRVWRTSGTHAVAEREASWQMLRALDALRGRLEAAVTNGAFALARVEAENRARAAAQVNGDPLV